ncbi:MAG: hypothetical protein K2F67_05845, partial [Eubacterium sp.]|nr:hypothetical protein [Eubacterium sp.]
MNKINRSLVKSQAQQIIKNKVFFLFLISFVVTIIANAGSNVSTTFKYINSLNSYGNSFEDYFDGYY